MVQIASPSSYSPFQVLPKLPAIVIQYFGDLANRVIWKTPPPQVLSIEEQEVLNAARKSDQEHFVGVDEVDEKEKEQSFTVFGTKAMEMFAESDPDLQLVKVQTKSGDLEVARGLLRDLRNQNKDLWKHRISGSIRNPVEDEAAIVEELYELCDKDKELLKKATLIGNQNLAIRIRHSITSQFIMEKGPAPMFDPLTPCEIDIDKFKDGMIRVTCAYNGAIKKVSYPAGNADILDKPVPFRGIGCFILGKSDEDDKPSIRVLFV